MDRLAVMAALNIAHDLIAESRKSSDTEASRHEDLLSLGGKLDQALKRYQG